MFVLAFTWSAVGGVASVVAAVAALVTILYARSTVFEARRGREQSRESHFELLAEQKAAGAAFVGAHREEMAERQRAYDVELKTQRIIELGRISQLLLDLVDVAREETINPPPHFAPPVQFRATRIPAMLVRLSVAVRLIDSLGGPKLETAGVLAERGYGGGSNPIQIVGDGIDALREIESLMSSDERVSIDDNRRTP